MPANSFVTGVFPMIPSRTGKRWARSAVTSAPNRKTPFSFRRSSFILPFFAEFPVISASSWLPSSTPPEIFKSPFRFLISKLNPVSTTFPCSSRPTIPIFFKTNASLIESASWPRPAYWPGSCALGQLWDWNLSACRYGVEPNRRWIAGKYGASRRA